MLVPPNGVPRYLKYEAPLNQRSEQFGRIVSINPNDHTLTVDVGAPADSHGNPVYLQGVRYSSDYVPKLNDWVRVTYVNRRPVVTTGHVMGPNPLDQTMLQIVAPDQIALKIISTKHIANISGDVIQGGTLNGQNVNFANIPGSAIVGPISASLIQGGTLDFSQFATANLYGWDIMGGSITNAQIASGTILGSNIAPNTITGQNIQQGTLTCANIAPHSITGYCIAYQTITNYNVAPYSLNASVLGGGIIDGLAVEMVNLDASKIQYNEGFSIAASPVTWADAAHQAVTSTSVQNLILFNNPEANPAVLLIGGSFHVNNQGTTNPPIIFGVDYVTPDGRAVTQYFQALSSQGNWVYLNGQSYIPNGDWSVLPLTITANLSGTESLRVFYQDTIGIPQDTVSAFVIQVNALP